MSYPGLFLQSLVRVDKKRLLAALILALALFLPLEYAVRAGLVRYLPEKYLLRDHHDYPAHALYTASRARSLADGVVPIYIFGGSGMREAVLTGPEIGKLASSAISGEQFQGFVMATALRSFADDLANLDLVREKPGIIVRTLDLRSPGPQILYLLTTIKPVVYFFEGIVRVKYHFIQPVFSDKKNKKDDQKE